MDLRQKKDDLSYLNGLFQEASGSGYGPRVTELFDLARQKEPKISPQEIKGLIKSHMLSKKLVGAQVPARYLEQAGANLARGLSDPVISQAALQIENLKFDDGRKLIPYFHKGNLLGIRFTSGVPRGLCDLWKEDPRKDRPW